MTSFLRLNGITVPVLAGSATLKQVDIGAEHRAVDGTPVFNRRATKRTWGFKTIPMVASKALAFRDLITGKGHVLNGVGVGSAIDQLGCYTSKGLAPSSLGGAFFSRNNGCKFTIPCPSQGAGLAACGLGWTAGYTGTWPMFTSTSPWTIAWWQDVAGNFVFHHNVITSAGGKWFDGATSVAAVDASVTSGALTIGSAGHAGDFCDLIALPFICPSDWPAQWYAYGNASALNAQGALPRLNADGLFLEQNALISVKGVCGELKAYLAKPGGVLTPNTHDFAFELTEA